MKEVNKINFSGKEEHQLLALWAAACAEHVLFNFESNCPGDKRVKQAIDAARAWSHGELSVSEARKFAFSAHAAARETKVTSAQYAARSAGHAAATAHVLDHAKHAAEYARKSSGHLSAERKWQLEKFQEIFKKGL